MPAARVLLVAVGLCLAGSAWAEDAKLKLQLPAEDVKLIVQTLGAIQCPTVAQMATCSRALGLIEELKRQVIEQAPK